MHNLLEHVQQADDLPSLPAVTLQILQMTQDQNVSVSRVAELVGRDPALAAKVLRMANSPLFATRQGIGSLPQAIMVLGLRTLKVLILSLSIVDSFAHRRTDWFDYTLFWRRSITQAAAGKLLARRVAPCLCDEAFVAGLLSDIGVLAMSQVAAESYAAAYRQAAGHHGLLGQAERAHLQTDHAEVGAALLCRWHLPENLCAAVALHHRDRTRQNLQGETGQLVDVVAAASRVADPFCDGGCLADMRADVARSLSLEEAALEPILADLDGHVQASASLLSVEIGQTGRYQALREQAILQLAELTVGTELERLQAQRSADQSQLREKQLAVAATTDALSGLANRAAFDRQIEQALCQAQATGRPVGLILCDIDHFKSINDTHGHPAGDRAIAATGRLLAEYAEGQAFAARYGGEEFALIVASCGTERLGRLARGVCERFRAAEVPGPHGPIRLRISVGAASTESLIYPSSSELIRLADQSLYRAKRAGRNRACIANLPTSCA